MVKYMINKAAYDAMSDEMKGHYLPNDKGDYVLVTSGDNAEVTNLRTQLGAQGTRLQTAETALATANHQLLTASAEADAKYKADLDAATETVAKLRTTAADSARNEIVNGIASRFNSPELFATVVGNRVKAEYSEAGELTVTCVDAKGVTITKEALNDEFVKNKDYATHLKATSTPTISNQPPAGNNIPTSGGAPTQSVVYNTEGKPVTVDFGTASNADIKAAVLASLPPQA